MKLLVVLGILGAFGVRTAPGIRISPAQVVLQNGTFAPPRTVLECVNDRHLYCCWTTPRVPQCGCDEKKCRQEGASVHSDQRRCSITLAHQESDGYQNAGAYTCQLYDMGTTTQIQNATTQLYVVNLKETPVIRSNVGPLQESEEAVEAEFECHSESQAPKERYRWWFKDQSLDLSSSTLRINLTRNDFNSSVTCVIERSTSDDKPLGIAKLSEDVIFDMNPAILEVLRIRPSNYEIQVESWPLPNFVRISPVAECDNQCIIYKLVNGRYVIDTSPYMENSLIVNQVLIKGQVYGAKTRINLLLNDDRLKEIQELYVGVGNSLNVAKVKIDLWRPMPLEKNFLASESNLDQSSFILIVVITSLVFILLIIGLVLVIVFRQRISESFKCGVYLVPPEDEEVPHKDPPEPEKVPINDEAPLPAPETEF